MALQFQMKSSTRHHCSLEVAAGSAPALQPEQGSMHRFNHWAILSMRGASVALHYEKHALVSFLSA